MPEQIYEYRSARMRLGTSLNTLDRSDI